MPRQPPVLIKKYGNRRLYDANESRYVTLAEVEEVVRSGRDIQVVDAKSGRDLTQPTLVQIILDSRGASELLPVPLLFQLIRMGDDALAEFFGRYVTYALDLYLQARQSANALMPFNPLAAMPFSAADRFARAWGQMSDWVAGPPRPAPVHDEAAPPPPDAAPQQNDVEIAALRREIEALRAEVEGGKIEKKPARRKKSAARGKTAPSKKMLRRTKKR